MKSFAVVSIALCLQSFSMAQFITWKDGKIGVNFAGYHAATGLGASGSSGGLFAEAGTPHGQVARAGLAGATGPKSSGGGLYAGASAGGGVDASAGLGGVVSDEGAAGGLFSAAEAGGKYAATGLGGATHQNGIPTSDTNIQPAVLTKTYTKYKRVNKYASVAKPVIVNDAVPVVDNTFSKHKSVYVGGFADGAVQGSKSVPAVYDSRLEASGSIGVQKNPTFFADIFNIPISTLSAVSKFLGNTASGANFQVRKEVVAG